MAMMRWLVIGALVAAPAPAAAQAPAPAPAAPPAPDKAFVPPRAHGSDVPYPADAPPHTEPVEVTVKLTVDPAGKVSRVELIGEAHPVFDDAVIAAARAFEFDPATYDGKPVAVEVTFTHTFLPPPPAPAPSVDDGPARSAVLRGKLVELGTRGPVTTATVTASAGERSYAIDADASGRFVLPLPDGDARITVNAPGHQVFVQREHLTAGQELAVTYLVERDRYDPYEIVVLGEQRREEVSRVALRGAEIKQMPGTFGDPYRVVQALPGVSSVASLLPFPIVRGNSPAATEAAIDGVRIPLLYHLGAGPSVVHPELIDEIDFYAGGAPSPYGGYTGGIIDGRTRRARSDERVIDFDANLLQAGGLIREPIRALGVTATAAGRYGYPGLLLRAVSDEGSLSYWDYQLRLDGGTANRGWTVFAFGASDEIDVRDDVAIPPGPMNPNPFPIYEKGPLRPELILRFHRLDLRGHYAFGALRASARAVIGVDRTLLHNDGEPETTFKSWVAEPSARLDWQPSAELRASLGVSGEFHRTTSRLPEPGPNPDDDPFAGVVLRGVGSSQTGSAFLDALWRPSRNWLVRPGVRSDVYSDREATRVALDPRLTVRYRLAQRELDDVPPDSDDSAIWLKGSAGVYHQPPRYLIPVPGLDQLPLSYGLLRSVQTSLGVEVPLRDRFELTAEGYYQQLDPTFFELALPKDHDVIAPYPVLFPNDLFPPRANREPFLDQFTVQRAGRSYGVETMLRRRSSTGLYGWLAYSLSLSERRDGTRWQPYDFDRTHLFNLVAGIPLGRNWDVGVRLQYQSGKPEPALGETIPRNAGYTRFDIRFDKHAVWMSWILDFYVDITNVAVMPEEFRTGEVLRYVLPTMGLRGRL
jgi:TonB family protein